MTAPDIADQIAVKRVKQAVEAGADIIATSCPVCVSQLKKAVDALAEGTGRIAVMDISEVVFMSTE